MGWNPDTKTRERRKHPRKQVADPRVWCVSGEFEELHTAVNFARELVDISLGGVCLVTKGVMRPGVKLSVEVQFAGGKLTASAKVAWSRQVKKEGNEFFLAGLQFTGKPTMTGGVREFLTGDKKCLGRSLTLLQRVERLAHDRGAVPIAGETKKREKEKKKRGFRRIAVILMVLLVIYVGSFWGLVLTGKLENGEGTPFRYLGPESTGVGEVALSLLYLPAYLGFKAIGMDLNYSP